MACIYKYGIVLGLLFISGCTHQKKEKLDLHHWKPLKVTITAYNSFPSQTTTIDPNVAAWGDTLKPGMKVIAVSRDLMRKGLKYNTMVRIDTLPDTFLVKDKMHYRHRNKIDIYMGRNKQKALDWGRKKLTIFYAEQKDSVVIGENSN
ncbi:3D domain-containing protein [Cellulophaga sp. HaHaR_3_176]|uniref:3D domain-containing protein n=1 Tax=Cellulophaga sp. HaHaR_3_176 TaxID=1942464 RepID=UPI001C1F3B86|nr:3D domain-containing protein [Cellulophaga sp. HaHaR_3_176]QWX85301.1 3D domain-containing protein [Cellulophaga sp. HaHaR_3_176]